MITTTLRKLKDASIKGGKNIFLTSREERQHKILSSKNTYFGELHGKDETASQGQQFTAVSAPHTSPHNFGTALLAKASGKHTWPFNDRNTLSNGAMRTRGKNTHPHRSTSNHEPWLVSQPEMVQTEREDPSRNPLGVHPCGRYNTNKDSLLKHEL